MSHIRANASASSVIAPVASDAKKNQTTSRVHTSKVTTPAVDAKQSAKQESDDHDSFLSKLAKAKNETPNGKVTSSKNHIASVSDELQAPHKAASFDVDATDDAALQPLAMEPELSQGTPEDSAVMTTNHNEKASALHGNDDSDDQQDASVTDVMLQGNDLLARLKQAHNTLNHDTPKAQSMPGKTAMHSVSAHDASLSTATTEEAKEQDKTLVTKGEKSDASLLDKLNALQHSSPVANHAQLEKQLLATQHKQRVNDSHALSALSPDSHSMLAHTATATANSLPAVNSAEAMATSQPMLLNRESAAQQVAEKVHMMLSKNLKNLDIRLDPPELGRMHIRLTMNNDIAHVHITVNNPQARDMIEHTLPRLREMFANQGVQLEQGSVSQQGAGQHAEHQQGQGNAAHHSTVLSHDDDPELGTSVHTQIDEPNSGISYFA